MAKIMQTENAVSGKEGILYLTINGSSLEYAEITKFESKIEYTKADVKRIGARMDGSKIVGAKGTGNMTVYYHRPEMRAMALEYLRTGKSPMFDVMVVNEDITSMAGKQTTIIKNIVPDGALLAMLDGESDDVLKEEIAFTFDDFDLLNQFKVTN
ncbi:phage tail tube protein [Cytobacillus praedii]|uniref:Phage tail protein n=1 Tax=Cytobacillus praedii TaxID=1742358 RepID=A0A4V6NAR8_9BACI|nr:phage tail tube protein [Cytobacillus praedii]TCJ01492.1 phage tail protein [Cytobacillus praedii]